MIFLVSASFQKIGSGSCLSKGMKSIESKKKCESAAKSLNLVDIEALDKQIDGRPHGCIYQTDTDWLGWNEPIGNENPDVPCGTQPSNSAVTYDCLCEGMND